MRIERLLTIALLSGLLLSCEPEGGHDVIPEEPTPEQPTPEQPTPEEPEFPENPLSTLEGDVDVVFTADDSLSYADCFGNYYHTDSYMWGLFFQNYTSKEQLYIEIMHADHLYEMPLGSYTASDNINDTGGAYQGRLRRGWLPGILVVHTPWQRGSKWRYSSNIRRLDNH